MLFMYIFQVNNNSDPNNKKRDRGLVGNMEIIIVELRSNISWSNTVCGSLPH